MCSLLAYLGVGSGAGTLPVSIPHRGPLPLVSSAPSDVKSTLEAQVPLPSAYCWSKFGTEAGEPASAILERKETERRSDDGIFLWGIGTSIRPSLLALLEADADPVVAFTPMLSRASARDRTPEAVVSWHAGRGLDGRTYLLPRHAVVTSSLSTRRHHYALVCRTELSLLQQCEELWIDDENLRNLRTGTRVGWSQVTSVVRQLDAPAESPRYRVAFKAQLTAPHLVTLEQPALLVPETDDDSCIAAIGAGAGSTQQQRCEHATLVHSCSWVSMSRGRATSRQR